MLNKPSENFNSIKKNQSEVKNTLNKMRNYLWVIKSRINEDENQVSNLEYKEEKTPNQNSKK